MKINKRYLVLSASVLGVAVLTACTTSGPSANAVKFPTAEQAVKSSWEKMQPGWDARLVQDETQKQCSAAKDKPAKDVAEKLEKLNQSMPVIYPASGKLLGDWKKGEAVAQSGYGMRVGDNTPNRANGGNCYACHQITPQELSYGTMGPSLLGYAKLRGTTAPIVKYTYDKIYTSHAFSACSNMPRFGLHKVLTPEQIADTVALLMDMNSPVNK